MLTSNLVFSGWGRIFKDPMTTAAAIDRLIHHAIILELGGTSYRTDARQAENGFLGTKDSALAKDAKIVVADAQL